MNLLLSLCLYFVRLVGYYVVLLNCEQKSEEKILDSVDTLHNTLIDNQCYPDKVRIRLQIGLQSEDTTR